MTVCERINEMEEEGGLFGLFSLRDWLLLIGVVLLVIGVWRRR